MRNDAIHKINERACIENRHDLQIANTFHMNKHKLKIKCYIYIYIALQTNERLIRWQTIISTCPVHTLKPGDKITK